MTSIRVGQGFDIHRLVAGRKLILGGVEIDSPVGSDAHSDGDALLHALIDALLGALAMGDIGDHFPPSDEKFRNADSAHLLARALELVSERGYAPVNMDGTVFLEKPKLGLYKLAIRERMAALLGLGLDHVSLKAKTAEGLGAIGNQEAVAASVVVLLEKKA